MINYCSAANGDTSGTGLKGQVNDISSVSCDTGYMASSDGEPTYLSTVSTHTGGIWVYSGGSCGIFSYDFLISNIATIYRFDKLLNLFCSRLLSAIMLFCQKQSKL